MRLDCTDNDNKQQQKRAIMVMVEKFNATANNNMHAKSMEAWKRSQRQCRF